VEQDTEILVIGAGPAGLAAAAELDARHHQVLLVEARERVGGRILTVRHPASPVPLDLGAEFVHGLPAVAPRTWRVAIESELPILDVPDRHHLAREGSLVDNPDFWDRVGRTIRKAGSTCTGSRARDLSFAEALARSGSTPAERATARAFVEGFHAADPDKLSMRALLRETRDSDAGQGDRAFRLLDGNIQLAHSLIARSVKVRCLHASPVTEIRWEPGSVEVLIEGDGTRRIRARAALVTVPVGPLLNIRFDPPLPPEKSEAAEGVLSGAAIKVLIGFKEPFWERRGAFDLGFVHSEERDFPTWWSALPFRTRFLTGWTGGPGAEALAGLGREELEDRALRSLSRIFRMKASSLAALTEIFLHHDWIRDPYSQGAYSYLAVGAVEAPSRLAAPVARTLYFAGEATTPGGIAGTVEGAIESGVRAASALIAAETPSSRRRTA